MKINASDYRPDPRRVVDVIITFEAPKVLTFGYCLGLASEIPGFEKKDVVALRIRASPFSIPAPDGISETYSVFEDGFLVVDKVPLEHDWFSPHQTLRFPLSFSSLVPFRVSVHVLIQYVQKERE